MLHAHYGFLFSYQYQLDISLMSSHFLVETLYYVKSNALKISKLDTNAMSLRCSMYLIFMLLLIIIRFTLTTQVDQIVVWWSFVISWAMYACYCIIKLHFYLNNIWWQIKFNHFKLKPFNFYFHLPYSFIHWWNKV